MWVTNNLGYDVELSGVHLYRASQQEVTEAQATALLANATYVLLKTNGQIVQTDNQPDANAQYYVRPLDGVITLNGFPSNPNGSPEVSPLEAFDIGKEEGGEADLEDNKETTIDVSTYTVPVEITPTSGKDGMKKATVTLDNIPSGADLESNHATTINVSTYTEPVEITPIQGKDGMEKVTVSLSNIPAGANMLYAWKNNNDYFYLNISTAPSNSADANNIKLILVDTSHYELEVVSFLVEGDVYAYVSDTEFTVTYSSSATAETYTRDATKDLEVWNAPPSVETTKQATIDVSTYDPSNKPVITPTAGKQSMAEVEVTLSNIPSGGSDVPSVMPLGTYDDDAIMLFGDKTKLTRLFAYDIEGNSGWIDDVSQTFGDSTLGENGLMITQNKLTYNLPVLCVEYDNKMYKAPASVSNYCEQYNFVETQSQATPPTSDTPSGTVASGTIVHLSTTETGGTIYYLDGNGVPVEYDDSNGIEITSDITIQAVVVVGGKFNSEYLELTYTVG